MGFTDRGLAKRLTKLNFPRPPMGYFESIEAGRAPNIDSLPVDLSGEINFVVISSFDIERFKSELYAKCLQTAQAPAVITAISPRELYALAWSHPMPQLTQVLNKSKEKIRSMMREIGLVGPGRGCWSASTRYMPVINCVDPDTPKLDLIDAHRLYLKDAVAFNQAILLSFTGGFLTLTAGSAVPECSRSTNKEHRKGSKKESKQSSRHASRLQVSEAFPAHFTQASPPFHNFRTVSVEIMLQWMDAEIDQSTAPNLRLRRDLAMYRLMHDNRLTTLATSALNIAHFHPTQCELESKMRRYELTDTTLIAICRYLSLRAVGHTESPLFASRREARMSRQGMSRDFSRWAKKAGVTGLNLRHLYVGQHPTEG